MPSSAPIYPALSPLLPTHMLILRSLHLNTQPRNNVFTSFVSRCLNSQMHKEFASDKEERAESVRTAEHEIRV